MYQCYPNVSKEEKYDLKSCYELNKYNSECSLNEVDGKFVKVLEGYPSFL